MKKLNEKYMLLIDGKFLKSHSFCGLVNEIADNIDYEISEIVNDYVIDNLNYNLDYDFGWGYAEKLAENEPEKYDEYFVNSFDYVEDDQYLEFIKQYFEKNNLKLNLYVNYTN